MTVLANVRPMRRAHAWRQPSAIADASVWLECSGDLIDVRSVDVLCIREATPGIEPIEFACPRYGTPHASLRFE